LVGYADYGNIGTNGNVVVKISGDPKDYYLSFNRAFGIASGGKFANWQNVVRNFRYLSPNL